MSRMTDEFAQIRAEVDTLAPPRILVWPIFKDETEEEAWAAYEARGNVVR